MVKIRPEIISLLKEIAERPVTDDDLLKVNMNTGHVDRSRCGNSHAIKCAMPSCSGITTGSHPYNNILTFCSKCQNRIRHVHDRKVKRKNITGKFRGYSRKNISLDKK